MTKETKPDAWMPLYIGDWTADTGHLSCEEDGAYFRLIRHYWRMGPLPDDDATLARLTGLDKRSWGRVKLAVAPFFTIAAGRWTHKRVDAELIKWGARKEKAVERARTAAEARWQAGDPGKPRPGGRKRHARSNATSNASSTRQALLEECPSSSSTVEDTPNSVSSHSGRDAHAERSSGSSSPRAWPGPADFRAEVAELKGEDFTASWLDHTSWQDVPERAIVCRLGLTARRLNHDLRKLLAKHGIVVRTEKAA